MIIDEWKGMYPSAWKGIITPESFSHPAKVSSKLAANIYKHAIAEGWLYEGSRIVDPFGGIGGFAFHAMLNGMDMTLVELEPKFVALAQANIEAWNAKYSGRLARWGTARIIQGDSRHLAQVIGAAEACISSPPYSETLLTQSPEYWAKKQSKLPDLIMPGHAKSLEDYHGSTPGNLGNMRPGDVDACISSPPFIQTSGGTNVTSTTGPLSDPALIHRHAAGNAATEAYGSSPGQLAALPPGAFQAAISSPPFEDCEPQQDKNFTAPHDSRNIKMGEYGSSSGQLGNDSGETFWSAAREIVAQVYQVLAPGAHAVWVVKSYVKNKALVPFPAQWQALCESVGFVTLHEHHALLVRYGATSIDIDGNHHEKKTESKSFFRRLAEKNGSPRIDFETILCMVKPGGEGGGWDGAISSPPFAESQTGGGIVNSGTPHQGTFSNTGGYREDMQGSTPGQLGSLPPGSPPDTRHGEGE